MANTVFDDLHATARGLADDQWIDVMLQSLDHREIDGLTLPGFPDEQTQRITNSLADLATMQSAVVIYQRVKTLVAAQGLTLTDDSRALDYGCGWGRIYRFFLKDLAPANLFGVDVDRRLIAACRATLPLDQFSTIEPIKAPLPRERWLRRCRQTGSKPLSFDDATFDLVFANSVFSHLNEQTHRATLDELARVTRPGGLLVLTVIGQPEFQRWHDSPPDKDVWARSVIGDMDDAARRLEGGEFVWASTGRRDRLEAYGLALVPDAWINTNWPSLLDVVGVHRFPGSPQAFAVARRNHATT